jgi:hypothetical protein
MLTNGFRTLKAHALFTLSSVLVVFDFSLAEIPFAGEQDGFIEAGEYLATGTITVPRGKTLTFAPGCIVRFKQYSGLVVEGALKCYGRPEAPIVFTSENQRAALPGQKETTPAPFDWNGIIIADSSAAAVLEYTRVAYSTYGLDVKSASSLVKLDKAVFIENGHGSVTVNGKLLDVKDNEPFSYSQPWPWPESDSLSEKKPAAAARVKAPVKKKSVPKPAAWKLPVRIGLGAIAAGGVGLAVYGHLQAEDYSKSYDATRIASVADDNEHKTRRAVDLRNFGQIAAGIAGLGIGITFFF